MNIDFTRFKAETKNEQEKQQDSKKPEETVDSFSVFKDAIEQGNGEKTDTDIFDESTEISIDEYYKMLNNPDLDKDSLSVLDKADGKQDNKISKINIEKMKKLSELKDKYKDNPDSEMMQYINKVIEIKGDGFLNNISFENNNGKEELIISDGENYITFNPETGEAEQDSAAPAWGILPGTFVGAFDGDTKDGTIGDTEQHSTGDCWLLAGVNALNCTEEGREIIKNALEYHNGYTVVHLATGDYVVKDSDITTTKGSSQYSSGDDDMIILELAVEQALDEIANGKIELKADAPWYLTNDTDDDGNRQSTKLWHSSTHGGWQAELWYYLTGKAGEHITEQDNMSDALDDFQKNNGKDIALGASTGKKHTEELSNKVDWLRKEGSKSDEGVKRYYLKDINGKEHKIGDNHAYSIKAVSDDTVTVINPWDSSDEIVITREQYLALFEDTQKIDLSENNQQKDYMAFNVKDENGNMQNYENRKIQYTDKGKIDYIAYENTDENGNTITAFDTNNDGIIDQYYQNGEYKDSLDTGKNEEDKTETQENEGEEIISKENPNGNFAFGNPRNEEFMCSEIVTVKDKATGNIIKQYYDENGKLRHESVSDKNGSSISEASYEKDGRVKIEGQYGMLTDENGEYFGIVRYVIQDVDINGEMKSDVPLSKEQCQKIEERHLFDYPQFIGAEVGFLAMFSDNAWEKAKDYLEENPNASYYEIEKYIYEHRYS